MPSQPLFVAVSAVLAFLLALALPALARRWRTRARRARVRRRWGAPLEPRQLSAPPLQVPTVLAGVLDLGATGEIVSFLPRGGGASEETVRVATASVPGAALVIDGTRVLLDPRLQVLVGSVETRAQRSVRSGDPVLVRGQLAHAPAAAEDATEADGAGCQAYRQRQAALHLEPQADPTWPDHPIPVVAVRSAPRQHSSASIGVASVLAITCGVAAHLGHPSAVRAAHALERARYAACAAEADRLLGQNDPWGALALRCADPETRARAHFVLGDFALASDDWLAAGALDPDREPTLSEAEAHSLSGRPLAARDTVLHMLRGNFDRNRVQGGVAHRWAQGLSRDETQALTCIADGFARAGGDLEAAADLEAWQHRARPKECDVVAADYGANIGIDGTRSPSEEIIQMLAAERWRRGGDSEFHSPDDVMNAPGAFFHLRPLAIEASMIAAVFPANAPHQRIEWDNEKTSYGHHAAELAAFAAVMGEPSRAELYLHLVDEVAASNPPYPTNRDDYPDEMEQVRFAWQKVLAVAASASLQAGDVARSERYFPDAEAHAKQIALHHLLLQQDPSASPALVDPAWGSIWFPGVDILTLAATGDGAAVADKLAATHTTERPVFRAIMARIREHQDALRTWSRTSFPAPCDRCGLDAVAENVSDHREIARLVGDTVLEERLGEVARKYIDAMLQRDGAPERLALARLYETITTDR